MPSILRNYAMDMSLLVVEAEGTLKNPAIAITLTLWCTVLAFIATATGYAAARARQYVVGRATATVTLLITTPVAVRILAAWLFYLVPSRRFFSVHFWGTPSIVIPTTVCTVSAAVTYLFYRVRRPYLA